MIDLFSDTSTRPTEGMRRAMAAAEVGDEQRGQDPTTNALQERVAALLGKEAAVFLPSGTMCNAISFLVHCRPGDEILMHRTSHPLNFEAGGPAALSGAVITPLEGDRGRYGPKAVGAAIREESRYSPRTRAVSVEQTTNLGGGACWNVDDLAAVTSVADEHGLVKHMDGARLMNAAVATGSSAADLAAGFDSVWLDFSKGLGAPIGAVLAGSRGFIEASWRHKQRIGGALRQSGVVAAAGLYALDHHVDRLAEDHANARLLAEGLADLTWAELDPDDVETNIVIFETAGPAAPIIEILAERGVGMTLLGNRAIRAVTHLDVSRSGIEQALEVLRGLEPPQ